VQAKCRQSAGKAQENGSEHVHRYGTTIAITTTSTICGLIGRLLANQ
jgi:hypothetical protein